MRKDNWLAPVTRTNQVLELSDKDFKATVRKMLQQAITNSLETKKKSKSQQRRSYFGKEPNGNYGTEKCNGNINLTGGGTVAEKR